MLGFSSSAKESKYSVLFEIGSASVGAAVSVHESNTVRLLWSKRIEFGYKCEDDYVRYVRSMYAALLEIGMQVTSEGFVKAKEIRPDFTMRGAQVYCVLAPPWFLGAVNAEAITKEKPFQVTQTILDKIRDDGYSNVCNTEDSMSWQDLMGTPVLLEYYTDIFKVQGYKVTNIGHRSTNDLFVQSYYSIVSESVQAHVSEVIERVLPNHPIHFVSSTRLLSGVHVQLEESDASHRAIFVEIKGEITSVVLLQNGIVQNIVTIPLGTNHVLRKVSPKAISVREAQDALDVLLKNNDDGDFSTLGEELQEALSEWHAHVEFSFKALTGGVAPPTDILLFVDGLWGALYEKTLAVPMQLPGIRETVQVETYTIGSMQKKSKNKNPEKGAMNDARLRMYAQLLWHGA